MPADDMNQPLDFESGVRFARFGLTLVADIANADDVPRWNAGDFFGETFGSKAAAAANSK
jgi:hypothetical protein